MTIPEAFELDGEWRGYETPDWGRDLRSTAGLVYGYIGGVVSVADVTTAIPKGTIALAASTANYVERTREGVVSARTGGFTPGRFPMAVVVTNANSVTGFTDYRSGDTIDATITPESKGAIGDGTFNDTLAVNNAIAAAAAFVPAHPVYLRRTYRVTALTNPSGVLFKGPGRITTAITGGPQQLTSYAYENQHRFGRTALSCFYQRTLDGLPCCIVMTGDSTTEQTGGVAAYRPDVILARLAKNAGAVGHTYINNGHSGQQAMEWLSTHLANDLTSNGGDAPDVMIIRWGGTNDFYYGRTVAQYLADMRAALTIIRADYDVSAMSILLMTANTMNDTPGRRDEYWYEQVTPGLRALALEFQCAFYDTYAHFPDARGGATDLWLDNTIGGGIGVHPKAIFNALIYSDVFQMMYPPALQNLTGGARTYSTYDRKVYPATPPSFYGAGISIDRADKVGGDPWPLDGTVISFRLPDGTAVGQFHYEYLTTPTQLMFRKGGVAGWTSWITLPSVKTQSYPALAGAWVPYDTDPRHVTYVVGPAQTIITGDSAAVSIVGDIDLRVDVKLDNYTLGANQTLIKKLHTNGQYSYDCYVRTDGYLVMRWTTDGITIKSAISTAACGVANGTRTQFRFTLDVDNGAGGYDFKAYKSTLGIDGGAWTQVGATVTVAGVTSIFDGTDAIYLGASVGGAFPAYGKIYGARIKSGIGGATVATFDPASSGTTGAATLLASTGETWTLSGFVLVDSAPRVSRSSQGMATIEVDVKSGAAASVICTIAAGFRPNRVVPFVGLTDTPGSCAFGEVRENGDVYLLSAASTGRVAFTASYVTPD